MALGVTGCRPTHDVSLAVDGRSLSVHSRAASVEILLADAGVTPGPEDLVIPGLQATLAGGETIQVVRVTHREVTYPWPVPAPSRVIPTAYLHRSETIDLVRGSPGMKRLTVRLTLHDGQVAGRDVLHEEWIATPIPARIICGIARLPRPYMLPARLKVRNVLRLHATAYTPGEKDNAPYRAGDTATGLRATYGVAAVDPRVIKLGTKLYVKGYGYCIAADTGAAIKGNRIDLCFPDPRVASLFGVREVTAYVLGTSWPKPRKSQAIAGKIESSSPGGRRITALAASPGSLGNAGPNGRAESEERK